MSEELTTTELSLSNTEQVMRFGKKLAKYIKNNRLSTTIQGNDYAHVDGWKFAGSNFGLSAIAHKPVKVSNNELIRVAYANFEKNGRNGKYVKEEIVFIGFYEDPTFQEVAKKYKITKEVVRTYFAYECECDIVRLSDGAIVSKGTGFCSNMESAKAGFDEYAVNSMSQTRSIGKGYRNIIGYVMNSAGYEGTPAEEMSEVQHQEAEQNKAESRAKVKPNEKQFLKILERAENGELDIDALQKSFIISDSQLDKLIDKNNANKSKSN